MSPPDLQTVAQSVARRAQRQGFVVPREVREELQQHGADAARWKDVLGLVQPALRFRQGRYYFPQPGGVRPRPEDRQRRIMHNVIRELIRAHKREAAQHERRGQDRVDFILPVQVWTDDQRQFTLLSRDLSLTGIRLIGTRSLLGHKVRVQLPRSDGTAPCSLIVRILWTCAVGDDLFENGGSFLDVTT